MRRAIRIGQAACTSLARKSEAALRAAGAKEEGCALGVQLAAVEVGLPQSAARFG